MDHSIFIAEQFTILDYINDPIVIYEIDQDLNFLKIIKVNTAFLDKYGYTIEDIPNLDLSLINTEQENVSELIKSIASNKNLLFERTHKTHDGTEFPVEVHSRYIESGDSRLIISTIRDITERKKFEQRLLASNKSKDNTLKIVSHDLRNPLSQIHGAINLLKNEQSDEGRKKLLAIAEEAKTNADALIQELLTTDEHQFQELISERLEVIKFCEDLLKHYKTLTRFKKNILIEAQLPEDPCFIYADKNKLVRVFDNILSNAVKFSPQHSVIRFNVKQKAHSVEFAITDQGIGIPEELYPFVFEKKSKAMREGIDGEKTFGLGLFIAKQIIALHKGKIEFESKENEGTTFRVLIPLA